MTDNDNDNEPLRTWDISVSTIVTVKLPAGVVPAGPNSSAFTQDAWRAVCDALALHAEAGAFNIDGTEDMTDEV